MAEATIRVAVAYAERERQTLIEVDVERGATALDAIEISGIRSLHPEISPDAPLGIHGRVVGAGAVLAAGDRVEIYRPLAQDPKDARRQRARAERAKEVRR